LLWAAEPTTPDVEWASGPSNPRAGLSRAERSCRVDGGDPGTGNVSDCGEGAVSAHHADCPSG
jgi:hypothetical protein